MTKESIAVLDYYTAALSPTTADFNNTPEGGDSFCCRWGAGLDCEMCRGGAGVHLPPAK